MFSLDFSSLDSVLAYIPQIVLGVLGLIILIMLARAGIAFFKGIRDSEILETARRRLLTALIAMLGVIIMAVAFNVVTLFLQRGAVFAPAEAGKEIPPSPAANFPPAPAAIKVGDRYFRGPASFGKNSAISQPSIYAILCKAGEDYDIIFIGAATRENLSRNKNYSCWLENCDNSAKNLYIAFFSTPADKYSAQQRSEAVKNLEAQTMPFCGPENQ